MLINCSEKQIEKSECAHFACLMYKLFKSSKDSDDLSIGFHRANDFGEEEGTNTERTKRNYQDGISLKDVFGFAEPHEIVTYGWGYKKTSQRNSDNNVGYLETRTGATAADRRPANEAIVEGINVSDFLWYDPHLTPITSERKSELEQTVSRSATDSAYIKRTVHIKEEWTQNNWIFEIGQEKGNYVAIDVLVGVIQREKFLSTHTKKWYTSSPKCHKCSMYYKYRKVSGCWKNCDSEHDKFSQP